MTARNLARAEARGSGAKRYAGAICAKHPERLGERITSNGICLSCNREKMRARRAENPEFYKAVVRASYLKNRDIYLARAKIRGRLRRTGVDEETFNALWELQRGRCALCYSELVRGRAHTDHCHDKKAPRGILCGPCNQAEGLIKRSGLSPEVFGKRLAAYIANPPASLLKK